MQVGFIGLGNQGGPIARQIIDKGFDVTLWARREATLDPYRDTGCQFVDSPQALGAACDLVGICVFDDDDVRSVVLGDGGVLVGMKPGGIIAIHSTVHPDTVKEIAAATEGTGVDVIDAPVSGGNRAATAGTLLVMVGGDAAVYERCLPVFSTYGDPVMHVGPLGAGQLAKLVNNMVFVANLKLAFDAVKLGAGLGLDGPKLVDTIMGGSGRSYAMSQWPLWSGGDVDAILRPTRSLHEVVRTATALAEQYGAPSEVLLELAQRATVGEPGPPPGR